jgi:hypothetical protein
VTDAFPLLFDNLPEQREPGVLYTDEHVLWRCERCKGTGKEENPFPPSHRRHAEWDPACRDCRGAGGEVTRWDQNPRLVRRWPR